MALRSTVNKNPAIRRGFLCAEIGILLAVFLIASPANSRVFDYAGEFTSCDAIVCSAIGIEVGDPITGFIDVDDAASGPNSTFTDTDIIFVSLSTPSFSISTTGAELGLATLTTDAAGEIVSGTWIVVTSVDTVIGDIDVDFALNAGTQTFDVTTDFLGFGEIASGVITIMLAPTADSDLDGIVDDVDNCTLVANPSQIDSNGDNIGNSCDADLNNDCDINFLDLGQMKSVFFSNDADADLVGPVGESDGVVNFFDLGKMKATFFGQPGPSAAGCN